MLRALAAALWGKPQAPSSLALTRAQVPEHLHEWLNPAPDEVLSTERDLNLKVELTRETPLFRGQVGGTGKPMEAARIVGQISNFVQHCVLSRTLKDGLTTFSLSETVTPHGGTPLKQDFFLLALRLTQQGAEFAHVMIAGQNISLNEKNAVSAVRVIDEFATSRLQGLTFDPAKRLGYYFGPSRALAALSAKRQKHLLREPPAGGQLPTGATQRPARP
jgi:hypothetical protein